MNQQMSLRQGLLGFFILFDLLLTKGESMDAAVIPILRFLQGPKQFFIPIFQRMYSWETSHCQQLWADVVRIGENPDISSHFLGSIVYMEPGAPRNV